MLVKILKTSLVLTLEDQTKVLINHKEMVQIQRHKTRMKMKVNLITKKSYIQTTREILTPMKKQWTKTKEDALSTSKS